MNKKSLTLGSLFDGSGGFPLAAEMCGITPLWASEIDPFCVAVTSKRFPNMKHLGDVTKINGAAIPPVDIITFGSPCQDLSVAGKRAGLDGSRSSLFLEAIRIFKEMRSVTNGIYPNVVVWENVPGAYSSAKGEDFRRVLEELAGIAEPGVSIPRPAKGEWNNSCGCIMGDGYSIAWRTLDAQYWGVPQRRKRIFLVADFRGGRAPEILFKREGLSRDFKSCQKAWERFATAFKKGFGKSKRHTLVNSVVYENHGRDCRYKGPVDTSPTITAHYGTGGNNTPFVVEQSMDGKVTVRRMTPLECCRGQGFPDWWYADVPHKDTPEYRMWGNGVALPCVLYIMEGVAEALGKVVEQQC